MTTNFAQASFKSTGSTTSRTLGARAADRINVKDYGAVGDNSNDDKAAIQAAIDAAFGSSSSPNGYTNRALNKALYFPVGTYLISDSITFTNVYGGWIYGDDVSINVSAASPTHAAVVINGMVETRFENISLFSASGSPCNLDLDWDGTWADLPVANTNGLRHNVFANMDLGTADMGIRVAHTGNDGAFNTFINVSITSTVSAGIELQGADAIGNMIIGGSTSCGRTNSQIGYKMTAGQFSVLMNIGNGGNATDIKVASNYPVAILGGRAETNDQFLEVSTGMVMVKGFNINDGSVNTANITGGKVIFDGCFGGTGQTITGSSGTLYIRGCTFPSSIHSTYTGTVAQEI